MPVVELPPEILRAGQPAPVSVRDAAGLLLIAKGAMLATEEQRLRLVSRPIYVDEAEGEQVKRALNGKLDAMLRDNARLGNLATAQPNGADIAATVAKTVREKFDAARAWADLQTRASVLVRDPLPADALPRLHRLQQDVLELIDHDADQALFVLVHAASTDPHQYSVVHALFVTVLAELAARQLPAIDPAWRESLRLAGLTMNVAMASLQDQLALQDGPPSARQRSQIDDHAVRGAASLRAAGVIDALWLGAIECHHAKNPGPLSAQAPALRLARVLQRADVYAARLSMRKSRPPMSAGDAVKAAYLDEQRQADDAGSAVVQAAGLYPPGSFVKLGSGELAVVLRRGAHPKAPRVASVVSRNGNALLEPTVRETRLRPHDVVGGVLPSAVRVRLNLEKLLKLA